VVVVRVTVRGEGEKRTRPSRATRELQQPAPGGRRDWAESRVSSSAFVFLDLDLLPFSIWIFLCSRSRSKLIFFYNSAPPFSPLSLRVESARFRWEFSDPNVKSLGLKDLQLCLTRNSVI
jgi:hypothetical protein